MNNSINSIRDSISAGQPIIQIVSYEEKRVENYLIKIAEQVLKSSKILYWDINNGITDGQQPVDQTTDPIRAMDYFLNSTETGIIVFRDLNPLIRQSPEIIRKLSKIRNRCFTSGPSNS